MSFEKVFTLFNEEGINARYEDKQTVAKSSLNQIYLTISNSALDFNQARLWINETTKFLEKVVSINRMQIITTYAFSNIKMDQGLPESTFVMIRQTLPEWFTMKGNEIKKQLGLVSSPTPKNTPS